MLVAVILLSGALGVVIRRWRSDMPRVVARDYAGTAVIVIVSAGLLAAGLAHRSAVNADRAALREAVARAQAWIGGSSACRIPRGASLHEHVRDPAGQRLPHVRA